MKRKPLPPAAQDEPIVNPEILAKAKEALENPSKSARCVICNGDAALNSPESLCWVCRRLKISAWRDSDSQISVQE